jgi:hypothetical protein
VIELLHTGLFFSCLIHHGQAIFSIPIKGAIKMKNKFQLRLRMFIGLIAFVTCILFYTAACQEGSAGPQYTVSYNSNGGTGSVPSQTVSRGSAIALPNGRRMLTKNSFAFAAWNTMPDGLGADFNSGSFYAPNSNTTLYARWVSDGFYYTVVYNANGGSGTMSSSAFTSGVFQNLRANTFTRSNNAFIGWATTAGGSVEYSDQQSVNNLTTVSGGTVTLYPKWASTYYHEVHSNRSDIYLYDGDQYNGWQLTTPFDIAALRNAGYKRFRITLNFDYRNNYGILSGDSRLYAAVLKGHPPNVTNVYHEEWWNRTNSSWYAVIFIGYADINDYNNNLTIRFSVSAHGRYIVGTLGGKHRSVTIEALNS